MTYLSLAAVFVLLSTLFLAVVVARRRPSRTWWSATGLTALAMAVLTAVFDSVMIAADLFRFDESALVGIRVGLAPLEDFAWPLAAVALVPPLFLLLSAPAPSDSPAARSESAR
jgi:lycopene cyclase domain-containing protein